MGAGRRCGAWVAAGAVAGYIVPVIGLVFVSICTAGPSDGWDVQSIPFVLFFLFAIYTVTGLWTVGVALGVGCGLACAWLPMGLRPWQRLAAFTGLTLLTVPALYYILPFWPIHFNLG